MSKPVDFLTVPLEGGGECVRLDRLTDGRVMCQLCFGYFPVEDLNPVEGGVEDVCKPCAIADHVRWVVATAVCPACQVAPGTPCHVGGRPLHAGHVHPQREEEARRTAA